MSYFRHAAPRLRFFIAITLTVLTTITLLQSSSRPWIGPATPPGPPDLAREIFLTAGHIGVFVSLVSVWTWALVTRMSLARALVYTVIAAFAYSILTEWGQSFVPDRTASVYDLVVNSTATLITAAVIRRMFST